MRAAASSLIAAALAALAAGCSADRPTTKMPDAGMGSDMLTAPDLDPGIPMSTPNSTVAIRGITTGTRVLVKGGPGDPTVKAVLPSGGFCIDAPLASSGATALTAFALKDGQISPPSTINVTMSASAPIPQDPTCSGQENPVCDPSEDNSSGTCSDGKDNDCDGYIDHCDTGCNGCIEDALGPNWDPFFVPMVAPGTYNLQICPCRSDWFAFSAGAGQTIHVKMTYQQSKIDLDMILQNPADAQNGSNNHVAISAGTTGTEDISYAPTSGGTYYLKIYPYSGDTGAYTLTVY